MKHIDHVAREREYHRTVLKRTKEAIEELELTLERPVALVSVEAHYSFDYAQQVNVTFQNNFHCIITGPLPM